MKRYMLLGDKECEPVGSTVFKTNERGWMGLGLRTVETWKESTMQEWRAMNPGKAEKEYVLYMRKFNKKHQMTPGVAAGTALMLQGHEEYTLPCRRYNLPKVEGNFMHDFGMLANCIGPMMCAMRSSFKTWCTQKRLPETLESFDAFLGCMEPDLPIATKMLGLMHRLLSALGPEQNQMQMSWGEEEFSNISGLSFSFLDS